jgi:hypothetical protein
MKTMLYGEAGEKPPKEEESRVLAVEAAKSKLLLHMCTQVAPLGFEVRGDVCVGDVPPGCLPCRHSRPCCGHMPPAWQTRKDVAQVFSGLLRRTVDGNQPGADYLVRHKDLLDTLVKGCALSFHVPRGARSKAA